MTKPAGACSSEGRAMARRLLRITTMPAVKNILELTNLPANASHDLGGLYGGLNRGMSIEHTIDESCDVLDTTALRINATIRHRPADPEDAFLLRSSFLFSNFFNAYIIPTYLIHTLKDFANRHPSATPAWCPMISITCELQVNHAHMLLFPFLPDSVIMADRVTVDERKTEFFVAAGEHLKQQIAEHIAQLAPGAPEELRLSVVLAPEFISDHTVKCVERSIPMLETIARTLQLLPIYRSLMSSSSNDFGVTLAPYYLGVGVSSINYVEMGSRSIWHASKPNVRHKLQACIYLYGAQTHTLSMDSLAIANRRIPMSMLSLYEVVLDKKKDAVFADTMLPFRCYLNREVRNSATLAPFLRARDMSMQSPIAEHNKYTVLSIDINLTHKSSSTATFKSLSSYIHFLVESSKNLFGIKYSALVYIELAQDTDTVKDCTVLHILDIGTQPKDGAPYRICDYDDLITYDEARHTTMLIQNGDAPPREKRDSRDALAKALERACASAKKRFPESALDAFARSTGIAPYVEDFLSSGTVQCTIILQDKQHVVQQPPSPMYTEMTGAPGFAEYPTNIPLPSIFGPMNAKLSVPYARSALSAKRQEDAETLPPTPPARHYTKACDGPAAHVVLDAADNDTAQAQSPKTQSHDIEPCASVAPQDVSTYENPDMIISAAQQVTERELRVAQHLCAPADAEIQSSTSKNCPVGGTEPHIADETASAAAGTTHNSASSAIPVQAAEPVVRHHNARTAKPYRRGSFTVALVVLGSCSLLASLATAAYVFFCRRVVDAALVNKCDAIFVAGLAGAIVLIVAMVTGVELYLNSGRKSTWVTTLTESDAPSSQSTGCCASVAALTVEQGTGCTQQSLGPLG